MEYTNHHDNYLIHAFYQCTVSTKYFLTYRFFNYASSIFYIVSM